MTTEDLWEVEIRIRRNGRCVGITKALGDTPGSGALERDDGPYGRGVHGLRESDWQRDGAVGREGVQRMITRCCLFCGRWGERAFYQVNDDGGWACRNDRACRRHREATVRRLPEVSSPPEPRG